MELTLPHVVVRSFRSDGGTHLVAALSVHAVEVSEARDRGESHRAAAGRPATLVVVTGAADPRAAGAEVHDDFGDVPVLIVADAAGPEPPAAGPFASVPASLPLQELCWHVVDALSRTALRPESPEHPLRPLAVEIDASGVIGSVGAGHAGWLLDGGHLRPGNSILDRIAPDDREAFAHAARQAAAATQFVSLRLLDGRGGTHPVHVGLRVAAAGRVAVRIQPLLVGSPVRGRLPDLRDPITGLLTRWAMARVLEARERDAAFGGSAVLLLKLDDFQAIANSVGFGETDTVLCRVAAALAEAFPWPAVCCRLMGDTFLASVPAAEDVARIEVDARRLIQQVNRIAPPGFGPGFRQGASIGIARVDGADQDLAVRLAEAAVVAAQAAGGNRTIVAGPALIGSLQASELTASMDLGNWEVWLQPVVRGADGKTEFLEALARFSGRRRQMASRADFFMAGRAAGLLERFDRMMWLRALDLVAAHPDATLSVNVAFETFASATFPDGFLERFRQIPSAAGRIIVEIAPRCMALPEGTILPRLEALAAAGIRVALDDFGSGVCSLRHLLQFPIACVKLDELVTGYVDDDPLQRDFVRTVVSLCRARGIVTVAEYTRTPEQMARLLEDGVDLLQGELIGMPRPAVEVLPAPAAPLPDGSRPAAAAGPREAAVTRTAGTGP